MGHEGSVVGHGEGIGGCGGDYGAVLGPVGESVAIVGGGRQCAVCTILVDPCATHRTTD